MAIGNFCLPTRIGQSVYGQSKFKEAESFLRSKQSPASRDMLRLTFQRFRYSAGLLYKCCCSLCKEMLQADMTTHRPTSESCSAVSQKTVSPCIINARIHRGQLNTQLAISRTDAKTRTWPTSHWFNY